MTKNIFESLSLIALILLIINMIVDSSLLFLIAAVLWAAYMIYCIINWREKKITFVVFGIILFFAALLMGVGYIIRMWTGV